MTTPAGWYDDGSGRQRYWDGAQWTEHFAPAAPVPSAPLSGPAVPSATTAGYGAEHYGALGSQAPATSAPRKKSRVGLYIGLGVGALLLVGVGVVLAFVLLVNNLTSGPREAFDSLAEAWQSKDCPAEYSVSMGSTETTLDDFCSNADYSWVDDYQDWDISVTGVERVNNTGTVTTRERYTDADTGARETETWEYGFEEVDGEWLYTGAEQILD
ncbi:DUF2510 domain-containing protein [Demequina sp.]|uniref:DUF2510 domain-containing protein n=1 Tax=Demequina sp. TaxID=2050685 RepID=UPI0025C100F1|nr:DUF2510 domain-containing protein [Demequina sp.]